MVIVADTSPLNYLLLIGEVEVLPRLYSRIVIPEGVLTELRARTAPAPVAEWIACPPRWLHVESSSVAESDLDLQILGQGEREAIALAQARLPNVLLLIDEGKGRLEVETDSGRSRVTVETDSVSTQYHGFGTMIAGKPEIFTGSKGFSNLRLGDRVEVTALMGPGVDPHLYKASEGDVRRLAGADLVLYNGLHLEAKLADVLAELGDRAAAVTDGIDRGRLLSPPEFEGQYDPHVWFDVALWAEAADVVAEQLDRVPRVWFIRIVDLHLNCQILRVLSTNHATKWLSVYREKDL